MGDIRLGPFRLRQRLATGGMGEVWAGTHAERGVPVAVKLVRASVLDAESERHFDREVWAQARLDHPSVVYLFDYGRLSADAAQAFTMKEGAPWLAMERCSSNLGDLAPGLDWEGLRQVVIPLLEALAHAHSRGVLHRDIKMSNVLVSTAADLRPGIKLADFGIAHALADEDEVTRAAGTPRYMAPEQITADWEQLGPWTDLYALGVLTWRLVMGRRPWAELQGRRLILAMMQKDLGWYEPRYPVPPALRSWIHRLTQKLPAKRYQLAADALADFEALPLIQVNGFWIPNITTVAGTLIPEEKSLDLARRASFVNPIGDPPSASEASIRMHAAGLGLMHLRQPAFIGRRIERRVLWDSLHEVSKRGRAKVISLLGPPGVGRGRFQQWLSQAAESSGQAICLWLAPTIGKPLGDQLFKTLRSWFRIGALEHAEAMEHVGSWTGEGPWLEDFVRMLRAQTADPEWIETAALGLAHLGRLRPLIVQLRGGHEELPALLEAVCALPHAPVLFLVDGVVEGEVLELGPLDDASMTRLADALVVLEPGVRAGLIRRASGSPGFLVQTLMHWNRENLLEPGEHGFRVTGDPRAMPPALAVVAHSRLVSLQEAFGQDTLDALTVAAVLGQTVDITVWEAVDGEGRGDLRRALLSWLSERRLILEEVARFRFASVAFREAVLALTSDLRPLHARCAQEFVDASRPLELGRHLMAAGAYRAALEPLREGIYQRIEQEGGRAALAESALLQNAVQSLEGPERIRWQAICREVDASIQLDLGHLDRAEAAAREVIRTAQLFSDKSLLARCWAHVGAVAGHRGRLASRKESYRQALALGKDVDPRLRAHWWTSLGTALLGLGDHEEWRACMIEAATCVERDSTDRSRFRIGIATSVEAQLDGRVEDALNALSLAYAAAAEAGVTTGRLAVLRARAHTLVHAGRHPEAYRAFLAALELAVLARPSRAPAILANAVALQLGFDDSPGAIELFRRHRFLLPPGQDGTRRRLPAHCAGLAVAALERDWRVCTYHLGRLRRHGTWQWAEIRSHLVLCRVAVDEAVLAGRPRLAEDIAKTALAASLRGGARSEREAVRTAAGLAAD